MPYSQSGQTWSPPKRLTWTDGTTEKTSLYIDKGDNLHLVWYDDSPGNADIFYKSSQDEGLNWTAPKRLSWNSDESWHPFVTADSQNNPHVVWQDNTPGNWEIFYKKSSDGGTSWSAIKRLTWTAGNTFWPLISFNSNDVLHLFWHDDARSSSGNYEIYYRKSTDEGNLWSALKRLTWTVASSFYVSVALGSDNSIHMVWADRNPGNWEIFYKKSTDSGNTWMVPVRLTWTDSESIRPCVCLDSLNNPYIVYCDDLSCYPKFYELYFKRSTDQGSTWSSTKRLSWNYGSSDYPKLAVDSKNNLFLIWENQLGDYISNMKDYEIYFKESTDGGSQWSPITRLTWTPNHSLYPDIAVDSKDQIHISWTDHRSGSAEVYYRNRK